MPSSLTFEQKLRRWADRNAPWKGAYVTEARRWQAARTRWPATCPRCTEPVYSNHWQLGHVKDQATHPHLRWEPANWRVEHPRCNRSAGATAENKRRKARIKNANRKAFLGRAGDSAPSSSELFPRMTPAFPFTTDLRLPGVGDGLPLHFSEPHPDAVATRAPEMVEHAEQRRGGPLRWFQWACAQRRYEVRADGSWCWPLVFESLPRQQGKSVDLTEDAAWIGSLPRDDSAWTGTFDSEDVGLILHAAHRVILSRAIQGKLWNWAYAQGFDVKQQLGDSRISWPHGPQWVTVAMESAYGFSPTRLLVDEAWSMDPAGFWNAMWPAMGDHPNVQAQFFSAANPEDRGLVADLRGDPTVCRLEWGAHPSEDLDDEVVWTAATAFMRPGRLALMRRGHGRPGFAENWLNVWPEPGDMARWIPQALTGDAAKPPVARVPPPSAVCAVECSLDGQRWAVASAWTFRGLIRARVWDMADLDACMRLVRGRSVHVHQAVFQRMPLSARFMAEPVSTAQHRAATGALAELLRRGRLAVAGVDDNAWTAVRTTPADGGEVIDARHSTGDVQSVKALAWAVLAVQSGQGQSGLVL